VTALGVLQLAPLIIEKIPTALRASQ